MYGLPAPVVTFPAVICALHPGRGPAACWATVDRPIMGWTAIANHCGDGFILCAGVIRALARPARAAFGGCRPARRPVGSVGRPG